MADPGRCPTCSCEITDGHTCPHTKAPSARELEARICLLQVAHAALHGEHHTIVDRLEALERELTFLSGYAAPRAANHEHTPRSEADVLTGGVSGVGGHTADEAKARCESGVGSERLTSPADSAYKLTDEEGDELYRAADGNYLFAHVESLVTRAVRGERERCESLHAATEARLAECEKHRDHLLALLAQSASSRTLLLDERDALKAKLAEAQKSINENLDESVRFNRGFDRAKSGEPWAAIEDEFEQMGWGWFHTPEAQKDRDTLRTQLAAVTKERDVQANSAWEQGSWLGAVGAVINAHMRLSDPEWAITNETRVYSGVVERLLRESRTEIAALKTQLADMARAAEGMVTRSAAKEAMRRFHLSSVRISADAMLDRVLLELSASRAGGKDTSKVFTSPDGAEHMLYEERGASPSEIIDCSKLVDTVPRDAALRAMACWAVDWSSMHRDVEPKHPFRDDCLDAALRETQGGEASNVQR